MTGTLLLFFAFTLAVVLGALMLAVRRLPEARTVTQAPAMPAPGSRTWSGRMMEALLYVGALAAPSGRRESGLRSRLAAAGYRHPAAVPVFQGIRVCAAALLAAGLAWLAAAQSAGAAAVLLAAVSGLGLGLLAPERVLEAMRQTRISRIQRALSAALDLMVLSVEAGQSLDVALAETSRELGQVFPELASEFAQVQLELRAGRHRSEVLLDLGRRTGSPELKKLAVVLIDSDRFGTSLASALRTHARFLRTRRRQAAQEAARKLSVKLIFPVFFLIMPAVFVVTLGPAVLSFLGAVQRYFAP